MKDLLGAIPNSIDIRESLPRPNWDLIGKWAESHCSHESRDELWTQIAYSWLSRLGDDLPGNYEVYESSEFLLLSADKTVGSKVLKFCGYARDVILDRLNGVANDVGYGKHVVLLLASIESYYDYVSDFYPEEGEFALSGGLYIGDGYGHFVICPSWGDNYERVIAHELNHALISHLPLPLWLNEGVTQVMEDAVMGESYFIADQDIVRRHRKYWNPETIDLFWSGASFSMPDDGQQLSYHLSQILVRNLISDFPEQINEVLRLANYLDAGNAAFIQVCNTPLADRVAQFLGDGNWEPRSNY